MCCGALKLDLFNNKGLMLKVLQFLKTEPGTLGWLNNSSSYSSSWMSFLFLFSSSSFSSLHPLPPPFSPPLLSLPPSPIIPPPSLLFLQLLLLHNRSTSAVCYFCPDSCSVTKAHVIIVSLMGVNDRERAVVSNIHVWNKENDYINTYTHICIYLPDAIKFICKKF